MGAISIYGQTRDSVEGQCGGTVWRDSVEGQCGEADMGQCVGTVCRDSV